MSRSSHSKGTVGCRPAAGRRVGSEVDDELVVAASAWEPTRISTRSPALIRRAGSVAGTPFTCTRPPAQSSSALLQEVPGTISPTQAAG